MVAPNRRSGTRLRCRAPARCGRHGVAREPLRAAAAAMCRRSSTAAPPVAISVYQRAPRPRQQLELAPDATERGPEVVATGAPAHAELVRQAATPRQRRRACTEARSRRRQPGIGDRDRRRHAGSRTDDVVRRRRRGRVVERRRDAEDRARQDHAARRPRLELRRDAPAGRSSISARRCRGGTT